jgi:hypothetical protein
VRPAIDLKHDPRFQTAEIHDEAVQHVLTAKLEAKHTAIAEQRPGVALCGRRATAQFARQCEFLRLRDPP